MGLEKGPAGVSVVAAIHELAPVAQAVHNLLQFRQAGLLRGVDGLLLGLQAFYALPGVRKHLVEVGCALGVDVQGSFCGGPQPVPGRRQLPR